jgi:molybdenum-dependent DNA-binding transcriptional regulator ModE
MWWLVSAMGVVIVAMFAISRRGGKQGGTSVTALRRRYFRVVHMPPALAEAALERHLATWRARSPGKSESWYMTRVLDALDHDRR